jgi:hypothetical protein
MSVWSQPGSNRRPPACKAGALPAELWPRVTECRAISLAQITPWVLQRERNPLEALLVEVEIARRALLEPEPVLLRRVAQEVRGLLEHVLHMLLILLLIAGELWMVPVA